MTDLNETVPTLKAMNEADADARQRIMTDLKETVPTLDDMNKCDEFLFCKMRLIVAEMPIISKVRLLGTGLSGDKQPDFCKQFEDDESNSTKSSSQAEV